MTTLLIAPPAAGNIGDQTLVDSALQHLTDEVQLIVGNEGDVPLDHVHGMLSERLPGVVNLAERNFESSHTLGYIIA